jgi:hypothetical protein
LPACSVGPIDEVVEVGDHEIGPALQEFVGATAAVNADDEAKAAGTASLHARERILDHGGALLRHVKLLCRVEIGVWGGLAGKVQTIDKRAVDAQIEQVVDPRRAKNGGAVVAR